jgi:hypothetical protein
VNSRGWKKEQRVSYGFISVLCLHCFMLGNNEPFYAVWTVKNNAAILWKPLCFVDLTGKTGLREGVPSQ